MYHIRLDRPHFVFLSHVKFAQTHEGLSASKLVFSCFQSVLQSGRHSELFTSLDLIVFI